MRWAEPGARRGSLQRGSRTEEHEGMEDNSLYSGRETARDFRVCVRRTEASERCRLKGDGVLRADTDALHLLDKAGDITYSWPYRYLRRFGRDKATFSFEAGRRCDSGEGSFEFDTKQGNVLFQAVETAINLQRVSLPHRQTSAGGQVSPEPTQTLSLPSPPHNTHPGQSRTPPPPQSRSHAPQTPATQALAVYSLVSEHPAAAGASQQQQLQQQQRPPMSRLEPPVDKVLTGVKSLNLETRGGPSPRKNQVKMIASCPLPHAEPSSSPATCPSITSSSRLSPNLRDMYSEIALPTPAERGTRKEKKGERGGGPAHPCLEPEYSLPFDTIAKNVMANLLNSHQPPVCQPGADPLYDSIDEMTIRHAFSADAPGPTYGKVEHIYDEPEGCAVPPPLNLHPSVYDDPEEMRGDAWRVMGTAVDPKGHEYPYNSRVDDYAVPKRPQRAFPLRQSTKEEEDEEEEEQKEEEEEEQEEQRDSPYNNVMAKMV